MSFYNLNSSDISFLPVDRARGISYWPNYIKFKNRIFKEDITINEYEVESERTSDYYSVKVIVKNNKIVDGSCSCFRYKEGYNCKHMAAVIFHDGDEIIKKSKSREQVTNNILNMFYEETKPNVIKKELKIAISLSFDDTYYGPTVYPNIKVGDTRLYSLNSKARLFFEAYNGEIEELKFGKDLTYNRNDYYFSPENEKILDFLKMVKVTNENNYYYRSSPFALYGNNIDRFFKLLDGRTFKVNDIYTFDSIHRENPYITHLNKKDNNYHFTFEKSKKLIELNDKFAIYDGKFYEVPSNISKLKRTMQDEGLEELTFKDNKLDLFTKGILKNVKDNIELDDSVKDKIIIVTKPGVKLYFDLNANSITCDVKLTYRDKEINYFDNTKEIVRDTEYESSVLQDLLKHNFNTENKPISIEDIDLIGEFLEEGLPALAEKYEIFTSQKLKETNIKKNMNVSSAFSIGKDNIMSYKFDLDGLDNNEIVNILNELKRKKKYYKLKSGDLISLEENDGLKELNSLIDSMDLSEKDIKKGHGVIPKYKAIYLDSLKNNYHIIKTNNLFDNLIKDFNSYKDVKLNLSTKDKKILRDYQVTGVNWLYNIYKCGFGGILADEMGLGKSIQLIYFIKEVLKEKPDAKILIIAPTSLVYNWSNEFDKFGSELKYKVFAENKNKRHEELSNLNDINILITTYGLIREDKEYYEKINFEVIAIDEAQNIKNNTSQMTQIIKSLKGNVKFALTGTPLENSVLELWSIFDFIMPGYLVSSLTFNKKYGIKNIDEDSVKVLDNLKKQIRPFILRRKKKDVVKELPDKIENNIYIELNKEQKKIYLAELEKTKKRMEELLEEGIFNKSRIEILKLLTRLRQICIDPSIIYENYQGGASKIEELIPMIKNIIANGHKILLFSTYKTAIDIVNRELTNNDISCYVIDGSVSSKKRIELVDKFNSDSTNVFLITLKAGGTGLNLTSADVVIHLDLWWNPQAENQATDRAHRIGQKNTVEVIKLICKGTIEERILELQNKKKFLSDNLIEGEDVDENIMSKLTTKDIKRLLSMDNNEE